MKSLLSAVAFILFLLLAPFSAFAQNTIDPCNVGGGTPPPGCGIINQENATGIIIGNIINFVFVVAVVLALGFLVYAGIRWITSGGDKEGVASARNMIIAAIVGLLIIVLSYFILNFVLQFLTGQKVTELTIPKLTG
jgi:Na+-driven multidrug efflux pump